MTDPNSFEPAIVALLDDIRKLEGELTDKQKMVNQLCGYAGVPEQFLNIQISNGGDMGNIRSDQFFGRPQATVISEYLQMRKNANLGAAKTREIYDALLQGGYHFQTKNRENSMISLRTAISKNTAKFAKLPNGTVGLVEWYDRIPKRVSTTITEEIIEDDEDGLTDQ